MKNFLYKFFFVFFIVVVMGLLIYTVGLKDLFIPDSVKTVRGDSIERYRQQAAKAEEDFKKEVQSAEKAGSAFEKLGIQYLKRKDWTPAIESLEKAVGYGRSGAVVHYSLAVAYANRGKALVRDGDVEKAEKHYRRAIDMNPDLYNARYGLAILKFYLKDEKEEAIDMMGAIVSQKPAYYQARFALARFYYEEKNPQKALSIYEELYSDLAAKGDTPAILEYKKSCRANINRLMTELSRKR